MRVLRACWRLLRGGFQILRGLWVCALVLPKLAPEQRMARVGDWSAQMVAALGIQVEALGEPSTAASLWVSNHISWLDILVINAVHPARFVSKADVRRWPVLGWMVACGGTLFIQRERKRDALRVVHQIAEALKAGDIVAMFPEGTTGDGQSLLPFHANLLQAAVSTEVPVQPLTLRYRDREAEPSRAVAWVGQMSLLQSLWQVVSAEQLTVRVSSLALVPSAGCERRELSDTLRGLMAAELARGTAEVATARASA